MIRPFRRQSSNFGKNFLLNTRRITTMTPLVWAGRQTAVIICDMWDDHWCKSAAQRCSRLAPRVNEFVGTVRAGGGLVIHAPSETMTFYSGVRQRERAKVIRLVKPPTPIAPRDIDRSREAELPIDDSDGGCDDVPPSYFTQHVRWTRQHPAIEIAERDIISDVGEEIYSAFTRSGITNIFMVGVHTNKCILGRSFGVRQMIMLGFNVVLVRDLTDSLYNPLKPPFVSHDRATELVVEHIEKYWCPSVSSGGVTLPNI
jgi:nicotinamidase-related amidase